ncbi:class I SAM-dependent RNA methyltransferase [Parahaliea maris]|uniref:Class I SAM-dependent RNA methyltransferase n=1 Tax=Parahaliea maris TaxID=2716870 RepID=A0A5C9A531_9GAMM|nr:TRAM domain-containing protein [Parahaliea maris]TXS95179.1 class I SAM-dependent RNA methyltransferase [Parahaliea maris]
MSLRQGAVFTATVRDLGSNGDAVIEHSSGRVVFVPGAWIGETVTVKVTELKSRFARGQLLAVDEPSSERRQPPCQYHGQGAVQCGGCPWQFMSYAAQCAAKQRRVEAELARAGIESALVHPLLPSSLEFGYRNRAQLRTDGRQLGFLASGGQKLVDIEHCPVLDPATAAHLQALRGRLPERQWRPSRRGKWTRIDIDAELGTSLNQRLPFRQGNDGQNRQMQDWLRSRLASQPRERKVIELFAGSGNFTAVLAEMGFVDIVAVEGVGEATEALEGRKLPGVDVLTRDLFAADAYPQLMRLHGDAEILVLDPPRDGLQGADSLFGARNQPSHVFYISCDLATFCRDARVMMERGFAPVEVQPLDLFPQTPHVELLAHFCCDL